MSVLPSCSTRHALMGLAAAGFTVVDAEPNEVDVLQRHGLKAMIHRPELEGASRLAGHRDMTTVIRQAATLPYLALRRRKV